MSWLDDLGDKAGNLLGSATENAGKYWDDALDAGGKLFDDVWEHEKEKFLGDKSAARSEMASHPQATPNNTGKTVPILGNGFQMNWQVAGVVVGALSLLLTLRRK